MTADPLRLAQDDPRFPACLRLAPEPPDAVWVLGDLGLLEARAVGIIGTRLPTHYGITVAYEAARALARDGLVVVSGMARGLDARAHQGALDAGGGTIAVLGCGIDVDYPRANLALLQAVRARGLVLTEFPPGTRPDKWRFPRRNRLIAALSEALLVVEGGADSGTANTARWMVESLGRDVFGVPGRLDDPMSAGPNLLIRDGAHMYLGPNDVRRLLRLPERPEDGPAAAAVARPATPPALPGAEASVFDCLTGHPTHVDALARRCALEPALLLAALSALECRGLVTQLPGQHFALAT